MEDVSKLRYQAVFLMGAGGSGKGFAGRKWMKYMPGGGSKGIDFKDPNQKKLENQRLTEQERGQTNLNWEKAKKDLGAKGVRITPLPGAKPGAKIPFNLYTYDSEGKEALLDPKNWEKELPPGVYSQVMGLKEVLFAAPVHEIPSYWRQVNPDLYKEELAGYSETQPGFVHEMSSTMAKAYFSAILESGDPLFVDGTGANAGKVADQMKAAKAYGYKTSLVFVSVPLTVNQIRNATRARNVDPKIVTTQWQKIGDNFAELRSMADKAKVIINRADSLDAATYKAHRDKIEGFIKQTTSFDSLYELVKRYAPSELSDWGKMLQSGEDIMKKERGRRFDRVEEKRKQLWLRDNPGKSEKDWEKSQKRQFIAKVFQRIGTGEKMRSVGEKEFQKALAKAGWPAPRYMHTKRTMDVEYMDRGTLVAHRTQMMTRGKVTNESYLVNVEYLKDD